MKPDNYHKNTRTKNLVILVALLIFGAGLLGWWFGNSNAPKSSGPNNTNQPIVANNSSTAEVKSLVRYDLPDGWKESTCPSSQAVYVLPNGTTLNCEDNPSSPVKISVDSGNNTDCNQLQNVQNVSKHICISLYINGHKSLKAETIYNNDSSYKKPTKINAYYINTGKGVIKVEYSRNSSDNEHQAGFDQLAMSVQVK